MNKHEFLGSGKANVLSLRLSYFLSPSYDKFPSGWIVERHNVGLQVEQKLDLLVRTLCCHFITFAAVCASEHAVHLGGINRITDCSHDFRKDYVCYSSNLVPKRVPLLQHTSSFHAFFCFSTSLMIREPGNCGKFAEIENVFFYVTQTSCMV
jgi:hypothetical protein